MSSVVPYYERAGITIYHGDALDVLYGLNVSIDAVVMDPPYASGARSEAQKSRKDHEGMLRGGRFSQPIENDSLTTPGFIWLIRQVGRLLHPSMVEGASLFSFIDWRQWPNLVGALDSADFRINNMVVWDKVDFGLGYGFRHQHELILHASKGTPLTFDHSVGTVIPCKRITSDDHPSPKPVVLIQKLVEVATGVGGLVIDPFMGCGPTLIACRATGRRALGVELEERYCEITARRLEQDSWLFTEPTATQSALFAEAPR